ncbi:phosphotransferase [Micromonospora sp. M12]
MRRLDTATVATDRPPRPIDAEHAAGLLLDDADQYALHTLVDQLGPARVTAHGDSLPANLLLNREHCALIDFEHTGSYLPGYDLALLHIVGAAASPTLTAAIAERVPTADITTADHVTLLLLTCREVRSHLGSAVGRARCYWSRSCCWTHRLCRSPCSR